VEERFVRLFVSVVLLSVVLLSICASAQVRKSFVSVSTAGSSDLPKVPYGSLGHPGYLVWNFAESARGVYNWKEFDQFVKAAPKDGRGVAQINLTLGYTPPWAVADKSSCTALKGIGCTMPPDNMQDWTDFVTTLVAHYNGITAPHVAYYEIWNEADTVHFWTSTPDVLAQMAQLAYPIILADGHSKIITPSMVWANGLGVTWMTQFLSAWTSLTGTTWPGLVSFHGYTSQTGIGAKLPVPMPEDPKSTNAPLQTMLTSFSALGYPMAISEGSWGVLGVKDHDSQAAWISHWYIIAASFPTMKFATWFEWGIPALSGLIENTDGTPTQAGLALGVVEGWIVGKKVSACSQTGHIWSCPVGSGLVVWDASQTCSHGVCTTAPYTPPSGYSGYYDLTGAYSTMSGTVNLGVKPVELVP
jgi:hypothetical protein